MLYEPKEIILKDGRTAIFRSPRAEDAAEMLEYLKTTSGETPYLIRTPQECNMTVKQEISFIQNILNSDTSVMIVCEVDGRIAGNCLLSFHRWIKSRHRGSVAIALLKEFWGLGIGTAMFEEMFTIARNRGGILQLELEVIEGNTRAMALYEKMGFKTVAEHPNDTRLEDGTLLSLFFMVRDMQGGTK